MGGRSAVTLKDVANAVGVSAYAVSRAINGQSGVAPETRERIIEAVARLGYVPNRLAQNLRRQSSKTIGVLTANSANAFYATLVAGLESVIVAEGYHTVTSDVTERGRYSPEREEAFLRSLMEMRVAGVLCTYRPQLSQMELLSDWSVPVVFVDCLPPEEFAGYPYILNAGERASMEVGLHFSEHGYTHWALVGHSADWPTREARERGFLEAAKKVGARVDIIEGGNDIGRATEAVNTYFHKGEAAGVRAVFATNEPLLNGTLRALRHHGRRVPQDVAVVGFDDFDWADLFTPPVSVVDQNIRRMGELAGSRVLSAIAGVPDGENDQLMPPDPVLILRESCGCPAGA